MNTQFQIHGLIEVALALRTQHFCISPHPDINLRHKYSFSSTDTFLLAIKYASS